MMADQSPLSLVNVQALWPSTPIHHAACAVTCHGASIYTGARDGTIVKWTTQVDRSNVHMSHAIPSLLLCGHSSPIITLHASPTSPHLVSIDRQDCVVVWDTAHDVALQRSNSLPFTPGHAATFVDHGVDRQEMVVVSVANMPTNGIAAKLLGSVQSDLHARTTTVLALIHPTTLHVQRMLLPVHAQSLDVDTDHQPVDQHNDMQHSDAQHNDALLCVQSHAAQDGGCVLLGVTARGHLLTWNPDAVGAIPTAPVASAPQTGPHTLRGPLVAAAFAPDASMLLLVGPCAIALLQRTSPPGVVPPSFDHVVYVGDPTGGGAAPTTGGPTDNEGAASQQRGWGSMRGPHGGSLFHVPAAAAGGGGGSGGSGGGGGLPLGAVEGSVPGSFTFATSPGADDTNAPHHPDSSVVNGAQLAGGVVCTPTTITHTSSASPAAGVAGAECKVVVWNHGGAAVVMQVDHHAGFVMDTYPLPHHPPTHHRPNAPTHHVAWGCMYHPTHPPPLTPHSPHNTLPHHPGLATPGGGSVASTPRGEGDGVSMQTTLVCVHACTTRWGSPQYTRDGGDGGGDSGGGVGWGDGGGGQYGQHGMVNSAPNDTYVGTVCMGNDGSQSTFCGNMLTSRLSDAWGVDEHQQDVPPQQQQGVQQEQQQQQQQQTPKRVSGNNEGLSDENKGLNDENKGVVTVAAAVGGQENPTLLVQGTSEGWLCVQSIAHAVTSPYIPSSSSSSAAAALQAPTPTPLQWHHAHKGHVTCVIEASFSLPPPTHPSPLAPPPIPPHAEQGRVVASGGSDGAVVVWVVDDVHGCVEEVVMEVHPHAAPVAALLLPPPNAPPPWNTTIISIDTHGTTALLLLSTRTLHMLMSPEAAPAAALGGLESLLGGGGVGSGGVRPAPGCGPSRVVWDFQRGFVGLVYDASSRGCLYDASHGYAASIDYGAARGGVEGGWNVDGGMVNGTVNRGGGYTGGVGGEEGPVLVLWDLYADMEDSIPSLHEGPFSNQGGGLLPASGAPRLIHDITSTRAAAGGRLEYDHDGCGHDGFDHDTGHNGHDAVHQGGTPCTKENQGGPCSAAPPPAGPPRGVVVLSADVVGLLYAEGGGNGHAGACLATALGLLHCWGVDAGADSALMEIMALCNVPGTPPPTPPDHPHPHQPACPTPHGFVCSQPALLSADGILTLQLPHGPRNGLGNCWVDGATQPTTQRSPVHPSSSPVHQHSPVHPSSTVHHSLGHLWLHSRVFITQRLLTVVAIAKRLMSRSMHLPEQVSSGCSVLLTLYALHLREVVSEVPIPLLDVLAQHWQAPAAALRDAARVLLASSCDPATNNNRFPRQVIAIQGMLQGGSTLPVFTPQLLQQYAVQIVVSAAACVFHHRRAADWLLQLSIPAAFALACTSPAPCAAAACGVVAEGLRSSGGAKWRVCLGDMTSAMNKMLLLCEKLALLAAHHRQHTPHPTDTTTHTHTSSTSGGLASKLSGGFMGMGGGGGGGGDSAATHPSQRQSMTSTGGGSGGVYGGSMDHTGGHTGAPWAASAVHKVAYIQANRDAAFGLLTAMAAADLPAFLHMLRTRLSEASGVPPTSSTHVTALTALVRVIHSPDAHADVIMFMPMLMKVLTRALDPANLALKRTCMPGIMTTIREAANHYPFVTIHRTTMQLAVGVPTRTPPPPTPHSPTHPTTSLLRSDGGSGSGRRDSLGGFSSTPGDQSSSGHQVVAVYELEGGTKRWALHTTAGIHDAEWVACVAWSPTGDLIAAYAPAVRCLFVWWLVRNWSARFSRGAASLQPKGVAMLGHDGVFVPVTATVLADRDGGSGREGGVDGGYVLRWVDEQHVELTCHGRVCGTARWPFAGV